MPRALIIDQRPQFLALLADTSFTHIVVEYKDRCSHFGVAYIQMLLATQGRALVIVNQADTSQDDLMQDFAAIITSFTAPLYGRRRASRKKQELIAA
jgi:predicted site-specific integrase-resolvase